MEFPKLYIKIENDIHNFIIEEKDVSKICLVFPFIYNSISSELTEQDGELHLCTYDQIASSCLGSKNYMSRFYAMNPLTKTMKIVVPTNSICNLDVNLESGNLHLRKLTLQNANISCLRGDIKIYNSNIDQLLVDGYESNISIDNLEGTTCLATTKTGNIKLAGNFSDSTTLKTTLGNVDILFDHDSLENTLIDINSKKVKHAIHPLKEIQKVLRFDAPHGHVDSNFF